MSLNNTIIHIEAQTVYVKKEQQLIYHPVFGHYNNSTQSLCWHMPNRTHATVTDICFLSRFKPKMGHRSTSAAFLTGKATALLK